MAKLEFFWDVGSPYTYLASTQMEGIRKRTGAEIVFRPFLLGGVFKSAGNTMPASIPAKAAYMMHDLARWCDHYGVVMKLPPEVPFPPNGLLAMRCAVAADIAGAGEAYCHAVFRAYWGEARDISTEREVSAVLDHIGLQPQRIVEAAQSQPVKDRLRATTEEAVQRGAFGAPALLIGDELYWGNDRLDFVERRLLQLG
jgi:2-hydroxychromene-2-carboxylate isomerase